VSWLFGTDAFLIDSEIYTGTALMQLCCLCTVGDKPLVTDSEVKDDGKVVIILCSL